MLERLRKLADPSIDAEDDGTEARRFTALRLLAADLFFATGLNATQQYRRARDRHHEAGNHWGAASPAGVGARRPLPLVWAPALVGSLAGAAHAMHVIRPSDSTERVSRILDGVVLSLGAAATAEAIYGAARRDEPLSLAPLLFAYAGLLGLLTERQERRVADEKRELAHRAPLVERLLPRRRPRLEKIVVHV